MMDDRIVCGEFFVVLVFYYDRDDCFDVGGVYGVVVFD